MARDQSLVTHAPGVFDTFRSGFYVPAVRFDFAISRRGRRFYDAVVVLPRERWRFHVVPAASG